MTTYPSAELDAMDVRAAKWMGWIERQGTRSLDGHKLWWKSEDEDDFEYLQPNWHPTRDLNQVAVMEDGLTDEERLAYLSNIQGWAEVSGLEMWWAFRHAPAPICVDALLKVRKP